MRPTGARALCGKAAIGPARRAAAQGPAAQDAAGGGSVKSTLTPIFEPIFEIYSDPNFRHYLREAETHEIIITRHGKPARLLIGFETEDDWFEYRLEND